MAEAFSPRLNDTLISNFLLCAVTVACGVLLWPSAAVTFGDERGRRPLVAGALLLALFPLIMGRDGPALVLAVGTVMQVFDHAGGLVPENTKRVTPGT